MASIASKQPISNRYNISGRSYQMHTCKTSCFAIIFKIQLIFYEKIKLNIYANQDDSASQLQASATVRISIVYDKMGYSGNSWEIIPKTDEW